MSSLEYTNSDSYMSSDVVDNDVHVKLQELRTRLVHVEQEKEQVEKSRSEMQEEYNAQRARLQKLYIQKEEELRNVMGDHSRLEEEVERLNRELENAKSEVVVASLLKENEVEEEKRKRQLEIDELNRIVNEVSSSSQNEVKDLRKVIDALQSQLAKERESLLLAPSHMFSEAKSFAKKMVGQLGPDFDKSEENLEDSMKKAKEDTDVIRSLVIPLEKEIEELKEKLRISDERLSKYESADGKPTNSAKNLIDWSARSSLEVDKDSADGGGGASPSKSIACDMCANYEAQLQTQQLLTQQLQKQKEIIEASMEKFKEDLAKETQFRKEMEEKWNEKKEVQKLQVSQLKSEVLASQTELSQLQQAFFSTKNEVKERIESLGFQREKINDQMVALQKENEKLVGKHSMHSEQLRNESINFPDNVDDLQVLLLSLHEELIAAKVAKEVTEEREKSLKCEIQLLENQMKSELSALKRSMSAENSAIRMKMEVKEQEHQIALEKLSLIETQLKAEIQALTSENERCLSIQEELKSRVSSLQRELSYGEEVQRDFVRLSQSLQVQLEKIRGADTQVRWQHEEDVVDCSGCHTRFTSHKKKIHCRHCGQIFCSSCLQFKVLSGPNKRPSQVCRVCHTLLNSETAPYFSQEPPQSPD